jgi:hypothetical protein
MFRILRRLSRYFGIADGIIREASMSNALDGLITTMLYEKNMQMNNYKIKTICLHVGNYLQRQ